jgi:NAD(P)-dependent dehydrogenase (short-subunit alcohol dehydrogenase family)
MSTVVVTGANRGIGLEFVRQYASVAQRSSPAREIHTMPMR